MGIKLVKVLSVIFLITLLFADFPPLWQNPRIPPKIGEAYAVDATKTYTFDSTTESWSATACGAAGAVCIWQSGDGSPANGSLEEPETRKNKGGTWTWQLSGITWESLGVPSGATVTAVDGSYNHTMAVCTNCNITGSNTSGTLSIRDSGDTATIATLETAVSYTGAATWASRNASGAQSIGAAYQASNTGIILKLSGSIQTNNVTGAAATIRQDQLSLVITYTAAAVVSVSVSDGVVSYGTLLANASKTTLSGELNDMQTATNDGNVTENFNIKGQDATGGGCTWTLVSTNGSDQYVHQFCNATDNSCTSPPTNYTALTTSYQALKTGVAVSGTVDFQLRLTTPNPSSCYGQQSVDVTVQAAQ